MLAQPCSCHNLFPLVDHALVTEPLTPPSHEGEEGEGEGEGGPSSLQSSSPSPQDTTTPAPMTTATTGNGVGTDASPPPEEDPLAADSATLPPRPTLHADSAIPDPLAADSATLSPPPTIPADSAIPTAAGDSSDAKYQSRSHGERDSSTSETLHRKETESPLESSPMEVTAPPDSSHSLETGSEDSPKVAISSHPSKHPPPLLKEATPTHSDEEAEEEEEVAPTRLLRSAVRRMRQSVSSEVEEGEGLVVSWSLKLMRSRPPSPEGDIRGESAETRELKQSLLVSEDHVHCPL